MAGRSLPQVAAWQSARLLRQNSGTENWLQLGPLTANLRKLAVTPPANPSAASGLVVMVWVVSISNHPLT
jgi:hypothetical protein